MASSWRNCLFLPILAMLVLSASSVAEGSNLANALRTEGRFNIFYSAMVSTDEIFSLEGRTQMNGSAYIVFAPTDDAVKDAATPEILACLQSPANRELLRKVLQYLQVITPTNVVVQSAQDLVKVAQDGKFIWTVYGKTIMVDQDGYGPVFVASDDGQGIVQVNEVRTTEPNVTLIPINVMLIASDVGDLIDVTCGSPVTAPLSTTAPLTLPMKSVSAPPSSIVTPSVDGSFQAPIPRRGLRSLQIE